jgi:hypothetical protein
MRHLHRLPHRQHRAGGRLPPQRRRPSGHEGNSGEIGTRGGNSRGETPRERHAAATAPAPRSAGRGPGAEAAPSRVLGFGQHAEVDRAR